MNALTQLIIERFFAPHVRVVDILKTDPTETSKNKLTSILLRNAFLSK